jgi:hypothetical protein
MSESPPAQAEHDPPRYHLPTDCLFTPQVDFWDIVCYRADVAEAPFKLRLRDMMGLMSHPTFARARREALRGRESPLIAIEEDDERFYVLRAQAAGWLDETLHKLRAYIERGWIVQLGRHRHAKWVLNYLLLERQRRLEKGGSPDTAGRFSLSWMKLKEALETAKGYRVEYRKLKDGFLLLERLGIVTPLSDQPTAKVGYGRRFQHCLNVSRLLDLSPRLLGRCQQLESGRLTLSEVLLCLLRFLLTDCQRRKQAHPWPLDWLHGEVEVDLEMQHRRRVAVRPELTWAAVGVLAQAGLLGHERAGYALSPQAVRKIGDPTALETQALTALVRVHADGGERPSLSPAEIARLDALLGPCRQRDAGRADLTRTIVLQMAYPPAMAVSLFTLLRRRMDRLSEEQFPALLACFAARKARGNFSLHPADILNDFLARLSNRRRDRRVTMRKTLKGRRAEVRAALPLPILPATLRRARLYCTLRHGQPLPAALAGRPLGISLWAGDRELYCTTVPLLDIRDDPLAPADITAPLRTLKGDPTLTLCFTLPQALPASRLLVRIEVEVVRRET